MATARIKSVIRRLSEELLHRAPASAKSESNTLEDSSRRDFLRLGALAGAAASLVELGTGAPASAQATASAPSSSAPNDLNEATVADLQAGMAAGHLTSVSLVNFYLSRIETLDESGPNVNSIIEVNPDAHAIALARDAERRAGIVRSALHGIPILLKDNIDTGDKMQTAAGSLALVGRPALIDSTVASKLRAAGAVILGKTTLSEWANFRSFFSSSGWSGRGGQCNNPYAIDRNPCGSSSGSGAAASANFAAVSIGTETDGSIVCPANNNGVVGIKPTVGLVSRAGVVPISHTQDTVGPHGRTVADAAVVLNVIASRTPDGRDLATGLSPLGMLGQPRPNLNGVDYTSFLNPNGLNGARIGVARQFEGFSPKLDAVFENALSAMTAAGATLVDVTFPHFHDIFVGNPESTVLFFDFKIDVQKYFASRIGVPVAGGTLQDAINFNNANAAQELQFFGQEIFELAETFVADPTAMQAFGFSYNDAIAADQLFGATEGIDLLLQQNSLDAIVAPTDNPPWPTDLINGDHFVIGTSSPCAIVGYPIINVPMGFVFGVPVGISFMGTAFSEPTLIKLASGFEAQVAARRPPQFLRTLPFNTPGLPSTVKSRRDIKPPAHFRPKFM